ncbi:MAG: hypothetical protein HUU55_15235 [Myxococcales bacterium]|nr:hypothetical protein [Myxococcales bacterium]
MVRSLLRATSPSFVCDAVEDSMKLVRLLVVTMIFGLLLGLGAPGCGEGGGSGGGGLGGGVAKRLSALKGNASKLAGAGKSKISAFVGKQQFNAVVDKNTGDFTIPNLPEGPKTLVVEQGGVSRTLKVPTTKDNAKMVSTIPETNLASESFDLGELHVASSGDYITAQRNPFEFLVDSDLDGMFDYFDSDWDNDGLLNWDDDSLFGDDWDEYADWSWESSDFYEDDWDCDLDGIVDWEDDYIECEGDEFWSWEDEYWESEDYGWNDEWESEECFDEFCDDWSDDGSDDWGDDGSDDWGDDGSDDWGDDGSDDGSDDCWEEDCF